MVVIQELLAYELDAKVDSAFAPEGFRCKVRVPISRLAAKTQTPFEVPG